MIISTKNFNPKSDPKLLCTCGHPLCDKRSVSLYVLKIVQLIRNDVGRPLTITSGGRCPNHPNEVNRYTPADHQNCVALDIRVRGGIERMELVRMGLKYDAKGIGVAGTFVHLAWRDTDKPVMWTY